MASTIKTQDLKTVTEGGQPVEKRFTSAQNVINVYENLVAEETEEARRRKMLQAMIDGQPPFDPKVLEATGQKHRSNVNSLGLRGLVESRALVFASIAVDNANMIDIRLKHGKSYREIPNMSQYGERVAFAFSSVVRDWAGFIPFLEMVSKESETYGIGPAIFTDPFTPFPTAVKRGNIKFPPASSTDIEDLDFVMVESEFTAGFFFRMLEDEEKAVELGWNPPAIREFLVATFVDEKEAANIPEADKGRSLLEALQQKLRDNRFLETNQFKTLRVLHTFPREVSGTRGVSHLITAARSDPKIGFLFESINQYEKMSNVFWWLPANNGDGTARSVRGIASYMAPMEQRADRLLNKMFDAAEISASIILQPRTKVGMNDLSFTEIGGFTILPPNLPPAQSQVVAPDLQKLGSVRELGLTIAQNNATGMRMTEAGGTERIYTGADRKTRGQVEIEQSTRQEASGRTNIVRITLLDKLFQEMFSRMMKLSKLPDAPWTGTEASVHFIQMCEDLGVPKEISSRLDQYYSVHASRDLIRGGSSMKAQQLLTILTQLGSMLDEDGRVSITRDIITAMSGQPATDRYRPEKSRDIMPSDQRSHARLENNSIEEGHPVEVGLDQAQWTHIPVHMEIPQQIAQMWKTGQIQNPEASLRTWSIATQHISEHLELGRRQPGMEGAAKGIEAELNKYIPVIRGLQLAASRMAKAREQEVAKQQELLANAQQTIQSQEVIAKVHEIDRKADLERMKQDSLNQVRAEKTKSQLDIASYKARIDSQIKMAKAQTDINIMSRKALGAEAVKVSPETPGA